MRELQIQPPLNKHELIGEFREILQKPEFHPSPYTQAVVILSAKYDTLPDGSIKEGSVENIARIAFGVQLLKEIVSARTHRPTDNIDLRQGPPLILNGETEQLPAMEQIAHDLGVPPEMIELVDCGQRGVGNTKTQFVAMEHDVRFADLKHFLFVTSIYHVPRAERTAEKTKRADTDYTVIPVPLEQYPFNIFMIRGEIRKILEYAKKGDIEEFPEDSVTLFQE